VSANEDAVVIVNKLNISRW